MKIDFIIQKAVGTINLYNKEIATLSTITSAEQSQGLNSDDLVRITVESAVKIAFEIGDKINILGRWYKINRLPSVKKTGNRLFSYTTELEGVQYDLARAAYDLTIDTTNNVLQDVQADMLTGNLERFARVLISNANRVFPGKWVLGEFPTGTEDKTLAFGETDNCLLVLQRICTEYNTEFDITQAGDVNTVNFRKAGQIFPYTFEYGKGKGLYSLERLNVSTANIVTRLKVFGGSRNITTKYRSARLCLPGKTKGQSYIEKAGPVSKYGIWEATKYFDHIYPKRTGKVTGVVAGDVLKLIDNTMNFDLNEKEADGITTKYLIEGVPAKIHFNTGNLSGYEFEIQEYDHVTKTFTLKTFEDERGEQFPSSKSTAFQFGINDEYVILDIALPQTYIDEAEAKLQTEGDAYYDQNSQPKVQYSLEVSEDFLKGLSGEGSITNIFSVGDYIPVRDTDIDVDKSVRIQSFTRDLLNPFSYKLNISDTVTTSITNKVISELIDIDNVTKINDIKNQVKARRDWRSAQELLGMIFDIEGNYYTEKIKPGSIETQMLSVGAKSTQFGLVGTVIQANYNSKNSVNVKGGVLSHYTIEEAGRDWNLADNTTSLTGDATPYYIYAKCQKSGTAGSIIFSTQKITVEQDPLFYHFFVGIVNSVDPELNVRSVALTYGFTTVNGRFVRTGRIQSNDGLTYFDLDTGVISGKITFRSTAGDQDLGDWADSILNNLNNTDQTIADMEDYLNDAFHDGIIEEAEAKAIETYINQIHTEKAEVEATYNKLYINPILQGTAKSNLLNAKISFFGTVDDLTSSINSVIADGKVTASEKQSINAIFNTYRTSYATFSTRIEEAKQFVEQAIKSIADDAKNAADNAQSMSSDALAAANTAKAITDKFGTTADGGLVTAVMILLREFNSLKNTAGFSGLQGEDRDQPSFWSGGTYEQAIELVKFLHHIAAETPAGTGEGQFDYNSKYKQLAPVTLLHNGAAKVGDFIVEKNGRIIMVDPATGMSRLAFQVEDLPTIADLMSDTVFGEKINVSAGNVGINYQSVTLSNSTEITQNSSRATFGGTTIDIIGTGRRQDNGMGSMATVSIYVIRNGVRYSRLASGDLQFVSQLDSIERTRINVPPSTRLLEKGIYYIELVLEISGNVSDVDGNSSASTFEWSFVQQNIRRQQYGKDGMMFFYSDHHFHFTEGKGLDIRGATNMPGVLFSGRVNLNGGFNRTWGAKKHASLTAVRNSTGYYTVHHSVGHSDYSVQITPETDQRVSYVANYGTTSFTVYFRNLSGALADSNFSFSIHGKNY